MPGLPSTHTKNVKRATRADGTGYVMPPRPRQLATELICPAIRI
ncbi:MAG: hypothetical protein ACK6DC_13720 [Planctomycetota bacterium]